MEKTKVVMIQRIQSFYLLVVTILSVIVFFSPIVELTNGDNTYILNYQGIGSIKGASEILINTWTITVLNFLIPVISALTLLSFKKRLLQIRLSVINIVLMIGFYPLLFIYIYFAKEYELAYQLEISVIFPVINAILTFLGIRAIGKDEALVRSLNRMR